MYETPPLSKSLIEAAAGIGRAETLNEGMTPLEKLNLDDFETSARNAMVFLRNAGFKVAVDTNTMKGIAVLSGGFKIGFILGGENIYFNLGELWVKDGKKEAIFKMVDFLKLVKNYGGQSKAGG